MRYLYNNIQVILIAFVVSSLAWLFGGTRGPLIVAVAPWLLLILAEIVFFLPQRHDKESIYDARDRVWDAMKHDPFAWIVALTLFLLLIPLANNGLCPDCDAALIAQGIDPSPRVSFLPFCVNRREHLSVFLWIALALMSALAVRYSLRGCGKRLLVKLLVWNGFAVALLGFVQAASGAPGPLWDYVPNHAPGGYFATWGYPNMAGCYFTLMFALAAAMWRRGCEDAERERVAADLEVGTESVSRHRAFWRRHHYLIPAAVCFFAAINTMSRAAILLSTTLAIVFFAHAFISFTRKLPRPTRVKRGLIALVVGGVVAFFAVVSIPDKVQREFDTTDTRTVLDRVTGKRDFNVPAAMAVWRDHPTFGCGGWGFRHFCVAKMSSAARKRFIEHPDWHSGSANVHNDYAQALAEHGCVGLALLLGAVLMLLIPIWKSWRYLYQLVRFAKTSKLPAKPVFLFVLPAPAFSILAGAVAVGVHAFGDCPLRSPAVLSLLFVSLAAVPGFLPRSSRHLGLRIGDGEDEQHEHSSHEHSSKERRK